MVSLASSGQWQAMDDNVVASSRYRQQNHDMLRRCAPLPRE